MSEYRLTAFRLQRSFLKFCHHFSSGKWLQKKSGWFHLSRHDYCFCLCVHICVFSGSLLLPSPCWADAFVPDCSVWSFVDSLRAYVVMLALFFFSSTLVLFFTFFFFLFVMWHFSADVLKANPSNLEAQITRVSFSIVSLAVYFCVCASFYPSLSQF